VHTDHQHVFKQFGLDPKKNRLQDKNVIGWIAKRGEAVIYLLLNENKRMNTLRIVSPMLQIPARRKEAFLRRCLEINFSIINCASPSTKSSWPSSLNGRSPASARRRWPTPRQPVPPGG